MNIQDMIVKLLVNMIPIIATIYIIVGIKFLYQKRINNVNYFSFLMFASAIYSFGYFLELNCEYLNTFLFVRNFEFLGSTFIPSFGTLFIAGLTGTKISKKIKSVLFSVSSFLWLLFISDPLHHLIYKSINFRVVGGFCIVDAVRGPVFYSLLTYYIVFLIFSILALSKAYKIAHQSNKKNSLHFLEKSFQIAWVAIIFILLGFDTYVEPAIVTIMILAGLFAINEIKNGMFELQINMWKETYENIGEPAFLIDKVENIVCKNIIANSLFYNNDKSFDDIIEILDDCEINRQQVFFETSGGIRWYDIKKSNFDIKKGFINYLLIDITDGKLAEESLKQTHQNYETFFNSIKDLLFVLNEEGCILHTNTTVIDRLGYTRLELLGKSILFVNPPEHRYEADRIVEKMLLGTAEFCSVPIVTKSGKQIPVETRMTKGFWDGKPAIFSVTKDISKIKLSEEKFSKLFHVNPSACCLSDLDDYKYTEVNESFYTLLGFDKNEVIGKTYSDLGIMTSEAIKTTIRENSARNITDVEVDLKAKNGDIKHVLLSSEIICVQNEKYRFTVFNDVTERKKKEIEIYNLSYNDQLTGLYNRRFYVEELRRLDTTRNLPLTIVMGDVNGLKIVNDSFGHVMGDELLKKVAQIIKLGCREDDIIARLGGDEFVIILPKTDSFEANEIIKRINNLSSKEKIGSIDISISFGFETKHTEEEKTEEIFKKAEDHMYKKKLFESPSMRGKIIGTIIKTLHEKNKREEQHSYRVSELCKSMGETLKLPEHEIQELKNIGLLHDIGKIAIDENILNKEGKLTEAELNEVKRHPEIGYRILNTVNDMSDMAKFVLHHHERWDGKGYPKGLKGEEIPFVSRIITIADAYDAMTSERSYRSALTNEVAIQELRKNGGIQFDKELVRVFIEKVLDKQRN